MLYGVLETCDIPNVPEGWDAFLVHVGWTNPYTEPPDGLPRHLMEAILRVPEGHGCPRAPADLNALVKEIGFGQGWSIFYQHIPHPIKRWSPERTFKYRRDRLALRIRKKYPMFAEQLIQEAMQKKPDYYGLAEGTNAE
jgi:hypothetical protein